MFGEEHSQPLFQHFGHQQISGARARLRCVHFPAAASRVRRMRITRFSKSKSVRLSAKVRRFPREKLPRAGIIDFDTPLAYSTNPGNFRLEVADFLEAGRHHQNRLRPPKSKSSARPRLDTTNLRDRRHSTRTVVQFLNQCPDSRTPRTYGL